MADNSGPDNAELSEDGSICGDGSGPVSRSSVTQVAYVVSKFDDMKKQLVMETGFRGILELPQITKVDRKFTLWLLSKVDTESKSIIVNDQCVANLIDFEVSRIMGIPCGRREVCPLVPGDKKSKGQFIQNFIGSEDPDTNSLTAAENNVKAQYDPLTVMSTKERHNFKVSFVVWVMGHLLAPSKKHNVVGDRFWGALLAPDEISQFNWAAYVIEELITAAKDVQNALRQKKNIPSITGCSILLQVMYFEEINMGSLNTPRDVLPRVKVYDGKSLSLMIAADKASSASGSGNPTWGSNVRSLPEVHSESLHLVSKSDAAKATVDTENEIIIDLGKHIRDKFGDQISLAQSIAFNWFHARCNHHYKQLRLKIQEDTIALVGKLFGTSNLSMHTKRPELIHSRRKASTQAYSEPSRPPIYARGIQKNKRGYQSSTSWYKDRGMKKRHVTFREHTLPETLLSGMSVSDVHDLRDQLSGSGSELKNVTHGSGFNIEVPSFDLGIDFKTEHKEDAPIPSPGNVGLAGADSPNWLNPAGMEESSDASGTPNVATGFPNASPEFNIRMTSLVSVTDSSDNSLSVGNDKCVESSKPLNSFNALYATPPSAKFTYPDQRIKDSSLSPASLSKILAEGDLVEKMTREEDCPNSNVKPWDDDYLESPIKKRVVGTPNLAESPWSYNLFHRSPPKDIVDRFFDDVSLSTYSVRNRPWLAHTSPRHIELDGTWIYKCFIIVGGLSYDVCDLAIRRLKQLDDIMYSDTSIPRWRHILESEFAIFALAGEIPYNRKAIIAQFIGPSLRHNLEDCRMLVVPAFVLLNWCCYFFDFKDKCVHVIDPLYNNDQEDVFGKMHHPNISKISASLANCFNMVFENWNEKMNGWDVRFIEPPIVDATSAETGLLMLMYLREFDGSKIHVANRASFLYFKRVMLYELMSLADNPVKPPISLTITIDD